MDEWSSTSPEEPSGGSGEAGAEETPSLPSLPARLVQVFVSPGRLFEALRERPVWFGALAVGALFVIVSVALIPADLWETFMREQMVRQGRPAPEQLPGATFIRLSSVVGGTLFWFIWAFVLAGLVTLVFSFILGDEGGYRQYLAVVSHALFIGAVGALVTVPLRIAQSDPQVTLSLGTFAFFLEEGYLYRVLSALDLFQLWGYGVMALGVSRIDPRRSAGNAAVVMYGIAVLAALLFGLAGG